MKTLLLIRHAKSSRDDIALPDKDRPLDDRGKRDAPKMGERLAKRDVKPDLILSSPARRALTTAQIIARKLDYKLKDIVVDVRLYAAAVDDLLDVIYGLQDKLERVALFRHNPELTALAHRLSRDGGTERTAGLAHSEAHASEHPALAAFCPSTIRRRSYRLRPLSCTYRPSARRPTADRSLKRLDSGTAARYRAPGELNAIRSPGPGVVNRPTWLFTPSPLPLAAIESTV